MKATNIKWDVDEDLTQEEQDDVLATLPHTVQVPNEAFNDVDDITDMAEISEAISDWLSDEYGYCHKGFEIEMEPETLRVDADLTFKDSLYSDVFGEDIVNEMLANIKSAEKNIIAGVNYSGIKSHEQRFSLKGYGDKMSLTEAKAKVLDICKYEWNANFGNKLGKWDDQEDEIKADFYHRVWANNVERLW